MSGNNIIEIPCNELDYKTYANLTFASGNLPAKAIDGIPQTVEHVRLSLKNRIQLLFKPKKFNVNGHEIKKMSYDEFLLDKTSVLTHELTHAQQDQILLNTEGGIEKLFELKKAKAPLATFEEFLEICPLYKTEIPNKKFKLDTEIPSSYQGLGFKYHPINIARAQADYTDSGADYYTNLLEADARLHEIGAGETFKKLFPNTELDEATLKKFKACKKSNLDFIVREMDKKSMFSK